jgi:3-oxoacyl-[acyl-carrier-protein] synthase-1
MRTPVGNDAVQTASAVRAGVNRFGRWEAMDLEFDGEAGVIASVLPDDLGDAAWVEKAEEMAPGPIYEALWQAKLYDLVEVRQARGRAHVTAYVATPYPDRPGVTQEAYRLFSLQAREHCIAPARADEVHLIPGDHVAGLAALARAVDDLRAGKTDVAVIGAVDSLLHGQLLTSLAAEGRLKTPLRPSGLIPGEAAVVLILERARDAAKRGAPVLGRVGAVAIDREETPLGPNQPIRAEGASRAVLAALERNGGPARVHRAIVDLTGERWRSLEWALVETRCLGELPYGWQLWHPADCVGDLGAATGLANVALALRAFARGYGGPDGVLISAAAARGERAATCVFPAQEAA